MADVVVGIDVSKNKLDVNLCGGGREKVKAFDNSSAGWRHLDSWLRDQKLRCALICLEATGRYSLGVALALHEAGYVVSIVNPAQIRDFARSKLGRNKTDDIDAALIREYGEKFSPRPWTPPTPAMRRLRELQTVRAGIVASLTEWKNRDGSGLEDQAARVLTGETVRHLATQLEAVDKVIAETIEGDNELRAKRDLLLTINGVGEILASIVLAELPGAGDLALGLRGCRLCRAEPRTTPFRKLHKPADADLAHWGCGIASGTLYASVDRDAVQSSG
jgi:transposase